MNRWVVGIDFGQRSDRTAIAAVEVVPGEVPDTHGSGVRVRRPKPWLDVRYLDRLPVGLDYPSQCSRIAALVEGTPELDGADVVVDATGVGVAVADSLRDVLRRGFWALTITASGQATQEGRRLSVPKRDLISRLAVVMDQRRLRVPEGLAEGRVLFDELGNFGVNITGSGHDVYGARSGHDDLVLACSYAVWLAERGQVNSGHAWLNAIWRGDGPAPTPNGDAIRARRGTPGPDR